MPLLSLVSFVFVSTDLVNVPEEFSALGGEEGIIVLVLKSNGNIIGNIAKGIS